jgi:photosystem II stability/assembly factor-like uncharacterized protein
MRIVGLAAVLLTTLSSSAALANGRFPNANQLVAAPKDSNRFAVRATYGLIQTFDAGKTWVWLCEGAVGYTGTFDPAIALTDDGTLLAGLPDGVSATRDRGCTWSHALGPSLVIDLARTAAAPERVLALSFGGDASTDTIVYASTDAGRTWSTAATIPELRGETVDFAPSDANRIYVSGTAAGRGVFLRSDNGGATFTAHDVGLLGGQAPFIAAVDPRDPNVVYVRVNGGLEDGAIGADSLLITRDGGTTFTRLTTTPRQLLGVALSPDGTSIAIGGPDDGLFVAQTADHVFTKRSNTRVRCLTWTTDALYACSARDFDGFALGKSTDSGSTFTSFFDVPQLTQLTCAAPSTVSATCADAWQGVSSMIGEDPNNFVPDTGRPTPAPSATPAAESGCSRCGVGRGSVPPIAWLALLLGVWGRARRSRLGPR